MPRGVTGNNQGGKATLPGSAASRSRARRLEGTRERVDQARERVGRERERLEAVRPQSRFLDALFRTVEHDDVTGGGVLAGAVAFRLFMFLIPYVFVLVATLGLVADISDRAPRELAQDFGVAGLAATAVVNLSGESFLTGLITFGAGTLALVLAARTLVKVLRVVHGLVWGVSPPKPSSLTRVALGLILLSTVALILVRLISGLREQTQVGGLVLVALFAVLPAGSWLLVSARAMPHAEGVTWRDLVPGAIVAGVGIQLLHVLTVVYISHQVASKSETYGTIGAALALLLWAYVLGRVLTGSAVVNAALWYRNHPARGVANRDVDTSILEFPNDR